MFDHSVFFHQFLVSAIKIARTCTCVKKKFLCRFTNIFLNIFYLDDEGDATVISAYVSNRRFNLIETKCSASKIANRDESRRHDVNFCNKIMYRIEEQTLSPSESIWKLTHLEEEIFFRFRFFELEVEVQVKGH